MFALKTNSTARRSLIVRVAVSATAAAAMLTAAGCDNAGEGALGGAALGALGGLVIGSVTGSAGKGAAIGAAIGGVGGAVVGDQNSRNARLNRERNSPYYDNASYGTYSSTTTEYYDYGYDDRYRRETHRHYHRDNHRCSSDCHHNW